MRNIVSRITCIAGLGFLLSATARADFVAYNFFGKDVSDNSVSNVTRLGVSPRLYLPTPIYFENFDSGTETLADLANRSVGITRVPFRVLTLEIVCRGQR